MSQPKSSPIPSSAFPMKADEDDVEGHKFTTSAVPQRPKADEDDVEGHAAKLPSAVPQRPKADEDDVEGHSKKTY